ncbi:hypothetical protein ABFG95_06940 [Achromobacter sp. HNDS-1]|uniref:Uncharacterized protein n=1 Tax=Achromobacter sp. HNDS-1 TaxID=3151598 RepID=A0AAU7LEX1_9BURK
MKYGKEWQCGVGAGLICGAVAGWIFATIGGWVVATNAKNWWDVATAIGTVGAVITALFFAVKDRSRQHLLDQAEAVVLRAQITPELRLFSKETANVYFVLKNFLRRAHGRDCLTPREKAQFGHWIVLAQLPVCSRLEGRFYRLPATESYALADIFGRVLRIADGLNAATSANHADGTGFVFIEEDLKCAIEELRQVCKSLSTLSKHLPDGFVGNFEEQRLRQISEGRW